MVCGSKEEPIAAEVLSPHIQNAELGQLFLQARKQCSLSQQEAAERINGISSVHFEWEAQTINSTVRQIEVIEKGDFL